MAQKKAVTTSDFKPTEPVLAGPVAEGETPTVDVATTAGDVSTDANLTDSGPDKPSDKPVKIKDPWGGNVTVSSDIAHHFK